MNRQIDSIMRQKPIPPRPGEENRTAKQTVVLPTTLSLFKEDIRFIQLCREVVWGSLTVEIKAAKPVMVHKVVEDIKLSD